jgi:Asp-tRNA(Asn)/Glu-tRNA(Gln) amidotransferase B subunit
VEDKYNIKEAVFNLRNYFFPDIPKKYDARRIPLKSMTTSRYSIRMQMKLIIAALAHVLCVVRV